MLGMHMIKVAALHKHWCVADSVKQFVSAPVPVDSSVGLPEEFLPAAQMFSSFMRLSVWYSLLYVVIEGYRELQLDDPTVNHFLAQEAHVDSLRRFHNAMFHYQTDPFSDKLMAFLEVHDATEWARGLNSAFKEFFERVLPVEETFAKMRRHA